MGTGGEGIGLPVGGMSMQIDEREALILRSVQFLDEVKDMTGHWASTAVHFESFGADTQLKSDDQEFTVRLANSGLTVRVGADQTLLNALRGEGVLVPSSCESGTCGSCKVGLLEGEADHRDFVLMDDEKNQHIMVCVSRACSEHLVLDL